MFKNATIYRTAYAVQPASPVDTIANAIQAAAFVPCGATQPVSMGWVPPRGEANGTLMEQIGGQWILKLMTETKVLPSDAVNRKLDDACKAIEQSTGRKPGKKQRKELKEEVVLELLAGALTRRSTMGVWLDPFGRTLVVDTSSSARADDAVTMVVKAFEHLSVSAISTRLSPQVAMAGWLQTGEPHEDFSIDRECELKSMDEMKSVVKYGRHPLDIDEIRAHIASGKVPTRLAMTYRGRVSFVLTDGGTLRKLEFLDVTAESRGKTDDNFDGDIAIMSGELRELIKSLNEGLGGEIVAGEEA